MSRPLSHWLLLAALIAMWGSSFMLTSIAVHAIPPTPLVTVRLLIAAAALLAVVLLSRLRFPGTGRFWLFSLALAIVGNSLPFWLISFGQQRIDSGLAGILMSIMPLTTIVLAHFFVAGERLNGARLSGFLLGFVGIVVLIGPEALLELGGEGTQLLYQLAVLGGAVCYAIQAVVARHRPPAHPLVAAAGVMLIACLIMLPVGGPAAPAALAAASPGALWAVAGLGLMSTAFATVVFLKLVSAAGPSFASMINYLIPVWALVVGMIFLDEEPRWQAMAALALILGGIALSETRGRRAAPARPARRAGT